MKAARSDGQKETAGSPLRSAPAGMTIRAKNQESQILRGERLTDSSPGRAEPKHPGGAYLTHAALNLSTTEPAPGGPATVFAWGAKAPYIYILGSHPGTL